MYTSYETADDDKTGYTGITPKQDKEMIEFTAQDVNGVRKNGIIEFVVYWDDKDHMKGVLGSRRSRMAMNRDMRQGRLRTEIVQRPATSKGGDREGSDSLGPKGEKEKGKETTKASWSLMSF